MTFPHPITQMWELSGSTCSKWPNPSSQVIENPEKPTEEAPLPLLTPDSGIEINAGRGKGGGNSALWSTSGLYLSLQITALGEEVKGYKYCLITLGKTPFPHFHLVLAFAESPHKKAHKKHLINKIITTCFQSG